MDTGLFNGFVGKPFTKHDLLLYIERLAPPLQG